MDVFAKCSNNPRQKTAIICDCGEMRQRDENSLGRLFRICQRKPEVLGILSQIV